MDWERHWVSWTDLRDTWPQIRRAWGLPRSFATALFYFDFFHALEHLNVQVIEIRSGERRLALFPVGVRKRGFLQEIHAMPWAMPGGVWISPAVPERRKPEVFKMIGDALRQISFFTFVDRFATVGLLWQFPKENLVHYVIDTPIQPHRSLLRSSKQAQKRWEIHPFSLPEMLHDLYPIYQKFQRIYHSPWLDRSFFEVFFTQVPEENRIALGLRDHEGWKGGMLGMGEGQEALLWFIFLEEEARKRGGYPYLVEAGIQEARERGWHRVDLGHHPGNNPGVAWVKQRMGAEKEVYPLFFRPRWMKNLREGVNRVWYRRCIHP